VLTRQDTLLSKQADVFNAVSGREGPAAFTATPSNNRRTQDEDVVVHEEPEPEPTPQDTPAQSVHPPSEPQAAQRGPDSEEPSEDDSEEKVSEKSSGEESEHESKLESDILRTQGRVTSYDDWLEQKAREDIEKQMKEEEEEIARKVKKAAEAHERPVTTE
jgi:hypothetical protein